MDHRSTQTKALDAEPLARISQAALPFAIWALVTAIFHVVVTSRENSLDRYLNAYMASAFNLALDVVADPSAVLDWTLPNANYLFPDLLML